MNQPALDPNDPNASNKPKLDPKIGVIRAAIRILKLKWGSMVVTVVVGVMLAVGLSILGTSRSYKAKAELLYRPIEDKYKMLYESPTIQTWQGMATSRPIMEKIQQQYELPFSPETLSKMFTVVQPPNTQQLSFKFMWGEKDETQEILAKVIKLFRERVTEVRRTTVSERMQEMRTALRDLRAERETKVTNLEKRLKGIPVGDIAQTLASWDKDRKTIMQNIADDRALLAGFNTEVAALNDKLAEERRKAKEEWARDRQAIMKKEGMADNQRRLEETRKKRIAMQQRMKIDAELEDYYRRRDKIALLVEKGIRKQSELDDIEGRIKAVEESIKITPEIEEMLKREKELQDLLIPDSNADAQAPEPVTAKAIKDKLFDKDLEIRQYKAKVDKQLSDIETLNEKYKLASGLKPEIQRIEAEIKQNVEKQNQIDANLQQLKLIESFGNVEFGIVSEAQVDRHPAASNRKKLFILLLGTSVMFGWTGVVGLGIRQHGLLPIGDWIEVLGIKPLGTIMIPKMSEQTAAEGEKMYRSIRELALQIRQELPDYGNVVLWTGLGAVERLNLSIVTLSACFANRDERVLILDACGSSRKKDMLLDIVDKKLVREAVLQTADGQQWLSEAESRENALAIPNLGEYLAFEHDLPSDIMLPTKVPGVDVIPFGRSQSPEGLATQRMSELMQTAREQYSLILLLAPPVQQEVDLKILASHADGVILTFHERMRMRWNLKKSIDHVTDLEAPILGTVQVVGKA